MSEADRTRLGRIAASAALLGLVIVFVGVWREAAAGWSALLVAGHFGLTLTLGAALVVSIHLVSGARWWWSLRGVYLGVARLIPVPLAVILLVLVGGLSAIYPWAQEDVLAHSEIVRGKTGWLNIPFFLVRAVLVLAVWSVVIRMLRNQIVEAGARPTEEERGGSVVAAVLFLISFALTISIATWDWVMSLEPEYYSTMSAVYTFASFFVGGSAAVTVATLLLARSGRLVLSQGQTHDLGKLLFAFSFFWAYIWFCQFMLTWYANIPEETIWFQHRMEGGWTGLFFANAAINFGIPFIVLQSARTKKRETVLLFAAITILVGRWIDSWLAVSPSLGEFRWPLNSVAATVAVLGLMAWLALKQVKDSPEDLPPAEA